MFAHNTESIAGNSGLGKRAPGHIYVRLIIFVNPAFTLSNLHLCVRFFLNNKCNKQMKN